MWPGYTDYNKIYSRCSVGYTVHTSRSNLVLMIITVVVLAIGVDVYVCWRSSIPYLGPEMVCTKWETKHLPFVDVIVMHEYYIRDT